MRWDALFADLEAQLDSQERAGVEAEIAERVHVEVGAVALVDRLRAHVGRPLVLHTGALMLRGEVREVGADFVLLAEDVARRDLVPLHAIQGVEGLGRQVAAPPPGAVLRRLGLRTALRGLLRERAEVRLVTAGTEVRGVVVRVGADHVDVVADVPGEVDSPTAPGRCVPLRAVLVVRSRT